MSKMRFIAAQFSAMLQAVRDTNAVLPAFTEVMNARGLPGRYHPRPFGDLAPGGILLPSSHGCC